MSLGGLATTSDTITIDLPAGSTATQIAGGVISGASTALTKQGAGTLILSNANTYAGVTTISAGVIQAQNNAALGTTVGNTVVASGAALEIIGGLTIAEPLSIAGTGISSGGAVRNVSGNNSLAGGVTMTAASRINSDADALTISTGGISGATLGVTVGGAGNTMISSVIGTTSGTLTKDGSGTLTLSGANTYTGTTTVNAGTLQLAGGSAIADTSAVVLANVAGAVLDLNGTNETIGTLSGGGATGGNVTLGNDRDTVGGRGYRG